MCVRRLSVSASWAEWGGNQTLALIWAELAREESPEVTSAEAGSRAENAEPVPSQGPGSRPESSLTHRWLCHLG